MFHQSSRLQPLSFVLLHFARYLYFDHVTSCLSYFTVLHFTSRTLLAEGCDSPYLLGFLVELLQWRLEGEQDDAQVPKSH